MLKEFLFKKAIEKQIAGMNEEQKKAVLEIFKDNPEFIEKILEEIETETKSGRNMSESVKYVMEKNQKQLIQLFQKGGFIK